MDFYRIKLTEPSPKSGVQDLYPDFVVGRSKDLMTRGRSFYAVWDEAAGLWSTDEYDVQRLVDEDLEREAERIRLETGNAPNVKYLSSYKSSVWTSFRQFMFNISDNVHQLDAELTFANTDVRKEHYVSRRLPYALEPGNPAAWDELVGTLYSLEERAKIEWAIGAVVAGDAKTIQKFLVFYGSAGTGKSTILNVIQQLFEGYTTTFDAKALGSSSNSFSTEAFKGNPLVAIQHDGDLSKIDDNTKLNSIVSHEEMTMNEKFKPSYTARVNAFLFMGTNQPVKISDSKSGIIRRLIDVHPTGARLSPNRYATLMSQINFELGAIAYHCLSVYREMGKNYYNRYRPTEMMLQTDVFFNFVEAYYDIFSAQEYTTLQQAYTLYKEFCAETGIEKPLPQYKMREEFRNYFDSFENRRSDGLNVLRSVYVGFNGTRFKTREDNSPSFSLVLDQEESLLDEVLEAMPAQYATESGTPKNKWAKVKTTLKDIDTRKEHYVKVPDGHIVIDFDLRDDSGAKSLERNLEAASVWPPTYGELSRSGAGVHLHYNYDGDVERLSSVYSDGIEVKAYRGDASLRRRRTRCNAVDIATISSGLPLKEAKVFNEDRIKSEAGLRALIERNLHKEIHPGTKPSVDFIKKILDDAYDSGVQYDVSDMKPQLISFANNSTNQSAAALKAVTQMHFVGRELDEVVAPEAPEDNADAPLVFFDVEVYPNLFVICWKIAGEETVHTLINPSANEVGNLLKMKLVGFNNRRYDNHILYGAFMGYDNAQIYELSQKLINGGRNEGTFGEAYNISYTDIYDFSSKKQSLKKFMVELGIFKMEMDIPWDQPVPEDMWDKVVEYCKNDVVGTEATFTARRGDFTAREILAELSGLTVNHTTQNHTARIIFGNDRNPQASFKYTDLSKEFPGYSYDAGKSTYKGEVTGEGGYVYAEPGIYEDVALLDVASMHPTSIMQLNLFGTEYTRNFSDLKLARLAIKHGDLKAARKMLNGKLKPFLEDEDLADDLSYALKIVINIVYGLTSAKFDNPFRDTRNKDNIVAKRGALFMVDLKEFVQEQGFTVVHIKTDSIKIANATPEIIKAVEEFGRKYGYDFEHEATYDKICLVNDAVYIAKEMVCAEPKWTAVGAQFQHPYIFKTLFTHETVTPEDLVETKQVTQGSIYLDFDAVQKPMFDYSGRHFVGRIGRFLPVTEESGGGILLRVKDEKAYAVTGTKGYLWAEADVILGKNAEPSLEIDMSYYEKLKDDALRAIEKYGDYEELVK